MISKDRRDAAAVSLSRFCRDAGTGFRTGWRVAAGTTLLRGACGVACVVEDESVVADVGVAAGVLL